MGPVCHRRLSAFIGGCGFLIHVTISQQQMFARKSRILGVLAGLGDVTVVALAFELAYLIRLIAPGMKPFRTDQVTWKIFAASLIIWWFAGLVVGAYRRVEIHDFVRIATNTLKHAIVAVAFMGAWIFLLKDDISRAFILIFGVTTPVLLVIYRFAGRRLQNLLRQDLDGQCHYVIVGTSPPAIDMARMVESGEDLGNRIVAFLQDQPVAEGATFRDDALRRSYPLRNLAMLPKMLQDHVVDEVIFAVDKQQLEQMEELFLSCEEEGVKTRVLVNFFPRLHSDVYLEKLQSVPLLTFGAAPENEYLLFLKRIFDVMFSAVLLVLLSPFYLLVAILVKLTSDGPIFYSRRSAPADSRRSGTLRTLAAPPPAHETGTHLSMGVGRPQSTGLPQLDAPGPRLHRTLESDARLQDSVPDNTTGTHRSRGELKLFNMDVQDGQDKNFGFYPVHPVHPC